MVELPSTRIDALLAYSTRCYRCLRYVRLQIRGGKCFACGMVGHSAREGAAKLYCPLYSKMDCSASHRLGSRECNLPVQNLRGTRYFENGQCVNREAGTSHPKIH